MKKFEWVRRFAAIPNGLTQAEVVKALGLPEPSVRHWIKKLGYPCKDGRDSWSDERKSQRRKFDWSTIDWSKENVEIARQYGVSRQRIHQIRNQINQSKPQTKGDNE